MSDFTDLQRDILETKQENPDASASEIADRVDCSEGYARDIPDEYDTAHLDADSGGTESSESSDGGNLLMKIILAPVYFVIWTLYATFKLMMWMLGLVLWFYKLVLPPYGN
jgi:hypothetical protein